MSFSDPAMSQIEGPYHAHNQAFVALHEIGHALGIGVGSNWNDLMREGTDYRFFAGEKAIEAYNALPRLIRVDYHPKNLSPWGGVSLAIFGYDKPVVEQPGGILFEGDKVPLDGWVHWGPTTGQELMSTGKVTTPYNAYMYSHFLSTISVGALEDMGYPVRDGFTDPFWVTVGENGDSIFPIRDSSAKSSAASVWPTMPIHCGVGPYRGFYERKQRVYCRATHCNKNNIEVFSEL